MDGSVGFIGSAILLPVQVTNEKVKALMELAQIKQEYQLLQEYDLFSIGILPVSYKLLFSFFFCNCFCFPVLELQFYH